MIEAKREVKDITSRHGHATHYARAATPNPNADGT
jgi:hypothetical protein